MPIHDIYSIPPPQFPSNRWGRIANRSLSPQERPRVQLVAVAFIFLLLTGPVFWIHPPRFDLGHRRLAGRHGHVRPGLSRNEAAALLAQRGGGQPEDGGGGGGDGGGVPHAGVLHLCLKLPPRERSSSTGIAAAGRSFGDVVRSAKGKSRGGGGVDMRHWAGVHVRTEVLLDESWGSPADAAAAATGGVDWSAEALRREFSARQVASSCDSNPLLALCCGLLGELDSLLELRTMLPARSVACIHHSRGNPLVRHDDDDDDGDDGDDGGESCGRDDDDDVAVASLAPMLADGAPNAALRSSSPTFAGHSHCGSVLVHTLSAEGGKPDRATQRRHPGFAYCVNSALLDVLARKARRLSAVGFRLRQGCKFLDRMKLDGDATKRLGAVKFMDEVLRYMGA